MRATLDIMLDGPRTLQFGVAELVQLERTLGGLGMVEIEARLARVSFDALTQALAIGLAGQDPTMSAAKAQTLVEQYLDRGGELRDLINAVSRVLTEATGSLRKRDEVPAGKAEAPAPARTPA